MKGFECHHVSVWRWITERGRRREPTCARIAIMIFSIPNWWNDSSCFCWSEVFFLLSFSHSGMFDDGVFVYLIAPLNQTQAVVKIIVYIFPFANMCSAWLCSATFQFELWPTGDRAEAPHLASDIIAPYGPWPCWSVYEYLLIKFLHFHKITSELHGSWPGYHGYTSPSVYVFLSFSYWRPGGGWGGGRTDLVQHALAQAAQETSSEEPVFHSSGFCFVNLEFWHWEYTPWAYVHFLSFRFHRRFSMRSSTWRSW